MTVKNKKTCMAALFCALFMTFTFMNAAGCAPKVLYTDKTLYTDPGFTGRMLSGHSVALLPVLGSKGPLQFEEDELDEVLEILSKARPDLKLIPTYGFETDFAFPNNEPLLFRFYHLLFKEEILTIKSHDSIWNRVKQDYLLVYSLRGGMSVRNLDKSVYKQFSIECELWSVRERAIVWRAQSSGASDDKRANEKRMLSESMKRLVNLIPAVQPGYGPESW